MLEFVGFLAAVLLAFFTGITLGAVAVRERFIKDGRFIEDGVLYEVRRVDEQTRGRSLGTPP